MPQHSISYGVLQGVGYQSLDLVETHVLSGTIYIAALAGSNNPSDRQSHRRNTGIGLAVVLILFKALERNRPQQLFGG